MTKTISEKRVLSDACKDGRGQPDIESHPYPYSYSYPPWSLYRTLLRITVVGLMAYPIFGPKMKVAAAGVEQQLLQTTVVERQQLLRVTVLIFFQRALPPMLLRRWGR